MAELLTSAFGATTAVQDIVKKFEWSKIDFTRASNAIAVPLAPSYGKLTSDIAHLLPVPTKVALAGVLISLGKIHAAERCYSAAVSNMMMNPIVECVPDGAKMLQIEKILKTSETGELGSASAMDEVKEWLAKLPTQDDIAEHLNNVFDAIANLVACAAPVPTEDLRCGKREKIYLLQIRVWALNQCSNVSHPEETVVGITSEFTSRTFEPRLDLISQISDAATTVATDKTHAIFGAALNQSH